MTCILTENLVSNNVPSKGQKDKVSHGNNRFKVKRSKDSRQSTNITYDETEAVEEMSLKEKENWQ